MRRFLSLPVAALLLVACSGDATAPEAALAGGATAAAQPADRCVNVEHAGLAYLDPFVELPDGLIGLGADWTPTTLGPYQGEMASVVTQQRFTGANGQGAAHWELVHAFRLDDDNWFLTHDRAVCAPAGSDPTTCRVNDVLTITGGVGIFANATGQLRNQGVIDLANFTLTTDIRGRVCGDGI